MDLAVRVVVAAVPVRQAVEQIGTMAGPEDQVQQLQSQGPHLHLLVVVVVVDETKQAQAVRAVAVVVLLVVVVRLLAQPIQVAVVAVGAWTQAAVQPVVRAVSSLGGLCNGTLCTT